jgi:hypothetical protein
VTQFSIGYEAAEEITKELLKQHYDWELEALNKRPEDAETQRDVAALRIVLKYFGVEV